MTREASGPMPRGPSQSDHGEQSGLRVAFVTTGLEGGGAEAMLYKLLRSLGDGDIVPFVASLGGTTRLAMAIRDIDVPLISLSLEPGFKAVMKLGVLRNSVATFAPSVVQGWMYHGNLAALLCRPFGRRRGAVLWSIRQSFGGFARERPLTATLIRLGARLSNLPKYIIYNSQTSARQHEAIGYDSRRTLVIPNGFDTTMFVPSVLSRERVRSSLGIQPNTVLLGHVARFHAMKDHWTMLRAVRRLLDEGLDVALVAIGRGVDRHNPAIKDMLVRLGLAGSPRLHLLGERDDIPSLTTAFDIACCSSAWGEAFPNVLGEAMACAVPCVTTDVGDAATIVGNFGVIVPASAPEAFSHGLRELITAGRGGRQVLGDRARDRVISSYSIDAVSRRYLEVFRESIAN